MKATLTRRLVRTAARALTVLAFSGAVVVSSVALAGPTINQITIDGSINPASADFILAAIEQTESDGGAALLIELDTPGGLVASTQDIIQGMLNARIPTIVYVTPRGAWAASAGTMITIAANVAAMTPGSSIGAAHPVSIGGGGGGSGGEGDSGAKDPSMEKAANLIASYVESIAKHRKRNVEWAAEAVRNSVAVDAEEALELNVIDLIANNRAELLAAIDGFEVEVDGQLETLNLTDATVVALEMTWLQLVFNFLADPNVAVILMLAGLLGLYIEFNNPGLILPGAAGAVCLVLTGFALQILPFDWVGFVLILSGLGLLIAEIFVSSFGLLFASGIVCFLLGGSLMFEKPDVSDLNVDFWSVLLPAVLGLSVFSGAVVLAVGRTIWGRQTAGVDEMIGMVGEATTALDLEGKVFIRGEFWNAQADEAIHSGERVEVTGVNGLVIHVRKAGSPR